MLILDPGHGGKDPGAVDPKDDDKYYTEESKIVLDIAKMTYAIGKLQGQLSQLTRERDIYPDWEERVESNPDDVFVSIHCNAARSIEAKGIECFYYPGSSGEELAQLIHDKIIERTGRGSRGVRARDDLYVLKETSCPAVLVECGFITNPEEEAMINTVKYQYKVAAAIVEAVKEFKEG